MIVGAGTAGCVLAARLSVDPRHRVTVIEAGPDLRAGTAPTAIEGPDALAALAVPGRTWSGVEVVRSRSSSSAPYLRGRGVGGSSVVNGMIATLGPRQVYDEWERNGCVGWSSTHLAGAASRIALRRSPADLAEIGEVDAALLAAIETSPSTMVDPFDAPIMRGSRLAPLTRTADGRRTSVVDAYLDPVRDHVVVHTDVVADRVVISGGRATGVILASGEEIPADEVIMCAGAIHTPALLAASGLDLPGLGVGIQDHPSVTFTLRLRRPATPGRLVMAAIAGLSSRDDRGADLQLLAMNRVDDEGEYGAVVLSLMDVHSRGRVTFADDPARPIVELDQLSDERDVDAMMSGVQSALGVVASDAFRSIADAVLIDDRGTTVDALSGGVADLRSWLLGHVDGLYHAGSSCRMGAAPDDGPGATTVVDPLLRVRGVGGLRICDASVFPRLPPVNVHLPVVLLAERAAELIAEGP